MQQENGDQQLQWTDGDGHKFPSPDFRQSVVRIETLRASNQIAAEPDYLTLGGGLGSFVWVDHLRIFGVPASAIHAIGVDPAPYGKFQRLCNNSQIPGHERLRSNSVSTPDNIWGFPGYASRESWRQLIQGHIGGLKYVMQVFGEPALSLTYTPRAGDVYNSLDREANRIGWSEIWTPGHILAVRKTDDGRYAIAYRVPAEFAGSQPRDRYMVARYVHFATGYPASRYLEDLQAFKHAYPEVNKVINAYEEHDDVYRKLECSGGTVVIRGRGIVASRILQRLSEIREKNKPLRILHLMRRPNTEGKPYDLARRHVANDIELQPFNWPKACFGGTLRADLERTPADERYNVLAQWDGTTSTSRPDWDDLIVEGKRDGWYKPFFGQVRSMSFDGEKLIVKIQSAQEFQERVELEADYMIDCTGLIADITANPIMRDLIDTYELRRNKANGPSAEQDLAGLHVTNCFEVEGLQNGAGRAYCAGVLALNGPYAGVDSFLGLQYAALRSVENLCASRARGILALGPVSSFIQWCKWCKGVAP